MTEITTDATSPPTGWQSLDLLQDKVLAWQEENFPGCNEWELVLGVIEEAGELAQCFLKLHRGIRKEEFNEERFQDAIGDITLYLMGICGNRNWRLSEILSSTAEKVLARNWRSEK